MNAVRRKQKRLVQSIIKFEETGSKSIADYTELIHTIILSFKTNSGLAGTQLVEAVDIALHRNNANVEQDIIDFCLK
jgi:hypothetical protein